MEICPRCESYTMTTALSSYCVHCNYSVETDVSIQPIKNKSKNVEAIKLINRLKLVGGILHAQATDSTTN